MSTETTRRAWAYLSRVAEPPCALLRELVATEGPVVAARMIWQQKEPAELTALVAGRRGVDRSAADLEFLAGRGGRLLTPDDDEWPYLAFQSFDSAVAEPTREAVAPLVLWVLGPARLDEVAERAVAIVGTRASTAYGDTLAADFAAGLEADLKEMPPEQRQAAEEEIRKAVERAMGVEQQRDTATADIANGGGDIL